MGVGKGVFNLNDLCGEVVEELRARLDNEKPVTNWLGGTQGE